MDMAEGTRSGERVRLGLLSRHFQSTEESFQAGNGRVDLKVGVDAQDDCAVYSISDSLDLVVGSDFVRGTGFDLFQKGLISLEDLGYYLVAANLSDIAAMGARPIGLTTVVRYTKAMTDKDFEEIIEGIALCAADHETPVIGGDIGGYEEAVLAATALGVVERSRALLRSTASMDQLLCLAGEVGIPQTALTYFRRAKPAGMNLSKADENHLLESWRRPRPRIREGRVLVQSGLARAAQDVSDGLKATIEQLCMASDVGAVVQGDALPIHESTLRVAEFLAVDPTALALTASVDFSLLFTIEERSRTECERAFADEGLNFAVIGSTVPARDGYALRRASGETTGLPGVTWDQQWDDPSKGLRP